MLAGVFLEPLVTTDTWGEQRRIKIYKMFTLLLIIVPDKRGYVFLYTQSEYVTVIDFSNGTMVTRTLLSAT